MAAMEHQQYTPMMASHEGPNPLRPYYRAPSIGERIEPLPSLSNSSAASASKSAGSSSFGSSARDMLSDLNYSNILGESASTTGESLRTLADQALWKYSSVFMAQPFEVAKMVLQAKAAGQQVQHGGRKERYQRRSLGSSYGSDRGYGSYRSADEATDDDDEPSYFTSNVPNKHFRDYTSQSESGRSISRASNRSSRTSNGSTRSSKPLYKLELRKPDALFEVLGQSWAREGAWGVWKGTNVTFLYGLLLKTIETWTRSMFSALLNLPDPGLTGNTYGGVGGLDILDSPAPFASLGVAVVAAGVAGLLLSPLDIVRARVMLTPLSEQPRAILPCLRSLRSWLCPSSLIAPTLLHSTLPTLISTSTPLFLRSNFRIDPVLTPTAYSICTFVASVFDLFITLPFETVLRRGQIQTAIQAVTTNKVTHSSSRSRAHRRQQSMEDENQASSSLATVVDVGPYTGVVSTMWRIVREEGETMAETGATTKGAPGTFAHKKVYASKKGQGVSGLWRGWRVGFWGLIGVWGAAAMNQASNKGGEF